MSNFEFLLTVVIATKNRQFYCIETIKSILNLDLDRTLQIAIADNSDSNEIEQFVRELGDIRIKYIYNNSKITNTDNFNNAMSLADGEYVTLIGDDDSLLPSVFTYLKWAKENNIDSFCSRKTAIYYWPNAIEMYPMGHLSLPKSSNSIDMVDINRELKSFLRNGLQHNLIFSLSKVYHGFVKREILNKVREKTNYFFGGLSPDIYSSIAVSTLVKINYVINTPLTIAGVCARSTTADLFTGKHRGELETMPHLINRSEYVWSSLVPRYYSPNTVWAESAIKAFEETGNSSLVKNYFNPYYLVAQGYINNRKDIGRLVVSKSKTYNREEIRDCWLFFMLKVSYYFMLIILKKIVSIFLTQLFYRNTDFNGVKDVNEAVEIAKRFYINKT